MSKWFEVELQTLTVYVVEVLDGENENDAIHKVSCIQYMRGKQAFTALPLPSDHLATIKQNCDYLKPLVEDDNDDEEDD